MQLRLTHGAFFFETKKNKNKKQMTVDNRAVAHK